MKLFKARPRIILMIGDDGIVVVPHNIPNESPFFVEQDNDSEAQDILDFIGRNPKARLSLLVDNLAQDFRTDELPKLNFIDQAKLIRRRLLQYFPSARLTASLPCRKTKNRVLLIGVHESNPAFGWADALRQSLPDISLLPIEGARLTASLMPEASQGWAMLVSRQRSGGFRQIVTYKHDLIFTRLTPLPAIGSVDDAEIIARDIKASLDYLSRHGLRDSKDLDVLLLMPDSLHHAPAFQNLPLHNIRSLSPLAAAQQLALPFAPQDSDGSADLLFAAHLVTGWRSALSLMLPETRHQWLTLTIHRCGLAFASACLGLALLSSAWRAGDLAVTLYRAQKEAVRHIEAQHALTQAQNNAAPVTEPLGRMRQALERRHIFEQRQPLPWQGLNELAAGLDDTTRIMSLDWKKDNDQAPEIFKISLRTLGSTASDDRAAVVETFARATQAIARAMPDFTLSITKPPYPALPQDSVTTASPHNSEDPIGQFILQRKEP